MNKKLLSIVGIVLVGTVCICLLAKNKSAEKMVVERLNEAVSHYTDMSIKDDQAYSLRVSDVQMLVTTYRPEYTICGVSTDEYTVQPNQVSESLTTEQEQDRSICDFEYLLLYDEKAKQFYSVRFEAKGRPVIPEFMEATELYDGTYYELALPDTDSVESITLKKDADPPIIISNRNDIERILDALGDTAPTTVSGETGTPVRVEEIINVDFDGGETIIGRLFLYKEDKTYFIEQTGNGVYTISQETYELIENYAPVNIDE